MPFEIQTDECFQANIKVVGVGGGGGNAINNMIENGIGGVQFLALNTDAQDLRKNKAPYKLKLGERGLGAGGNPEKGREAAHETTETLRSLFHNTDMVFVAAGMGGGTGTGAAPVVAKMAREAGALTVGVVTKPFTFEGKPRMKNAETGIEELRKNVDSLIVIPNDRLLGIAGKNMTFFDSFKLADNVLYQAVKGISDLITGTGVINIDFADVRSVMHNTGIALIGIGVASGDGRATEAANRAISNPLLDNISLHGSRGLLLNITGSPSMTIGEINEIADIIRETAHDDVNLFFGAQFDESLGEEIRVTVVATGFEEEAAVSRKPEVHKPVRPVVSTGEFNEDDYEFPAYLRRMQD